MKTQKQVNEEFKHLQENYKAIKNRIRYQPNKDVIMVKNPKTGETMTQAEYQESIKQQPIL